VSRKDPTDPFDGLDVSEQLTPEEVARLVKREEVPPEKWITMPVSDHGDLDRPEPGYEGRP
jgi:hypothetical protein